MIGQCFNHDWFVKRTSTTAFSLLSNADSGWKKITLPYDAMIHERPSETTLNGAQTGFFPGGNYVFTKKIYVPETWKEQSAILEFEGVYQTAMVYINDEFAMSNLYGYSSFFVELDHYLKYGEENEIRVIADNTQEPNSRYYTGSGIYRDVNLYLGGKVHIPVNGVKISTSYSSSESAVIEIETKIKSIIREKSKVTVFTKISRNNIVVNEDRVDVTMFSGAEETVRQSLCIMNPDLWDCDSPALYDCCISIIEGDQVIDVWSDRFGIRSISLDAEFGLKINGKTVKLRGSCVHHDNGILGAATFADAEERRCKQLKEAGFNSIRSAHNPLSKAMLRACDKYGIIVMDELSDVWTDHKNNQDFALHFNDAWEKEVRRMVEKDYNHPSVIFYSIGNEIKELGSDSGARRTRGISNKFHELDPTRYTTAGINGLMALGARGDLHTVMQEILAAQKNEAANSPDNDVGSNGINKTLGLIAGKSGDRLAIHPLLSSSISECETALDVIGLNYLTGRHVLERKLHPNKTVVGTETYPADIARLWGLVKQYPHILGDYTWTGYDYLGEAGCGIFHYDGNANFSSVFPERAAYIGDIDLTGYRRPISYLREIVYGLRDDPYIAVERLNHYGEIPSKTPWMLKDNIASWTWPGYEGKPAIVDVYSNAEEVELFLNGRSLGKKPAGEANGFTATYSLSYEAGMLKAVNYIGGKEVNSHILITADSKVSLKAVSDKVVLKTGEQDLAFITLSLTDGNGNENLFDSRDIHIKIEGEGCLHGFGSAIPSTTASYDDECWKTYDGRAMAVIRSGKRCGKINVTFSAENCNDVNLELKVE